MRELSPIALTMAFALLGAASCGEGALEAQPSPRLERGPTRSEAPRRLSAEWIGEGPSEGPVLVLLHGYGAPGDDLVPLARSLALPASVRVALPRAPLSLGGNARAWWHLGPRGSGPADRGRERPEGLAEARRDLVAWLEAETSSRGLRIDRTVIAGFSQGAMLATEVALGLDTQPAGLAALSGGPVDEARWLELAPRRRGMPTLVTHGRGDPLLSFSAAERLARGLGEAGLDVRFFPFEGTHGIPPEVRAELDAFCRRALDP